jgi:hypothetical protein
LNSQAIGKAGFDRGLSGPVSITLTGIPYKAASGLKTQSTSFGTTAKTVEIQILSCATTVNASGSSGVADHEELYKNFPGLVADATASITGGTAKVNIPPIPQGEHFIVANFFSDTNEGENPASPSVDNYLHLVAQTEKFVNPQPGQPLDITMPVYNTYATVANLNASVAAATTSTTFTSGVISTTTSGLLLRMAHWDYSKLGDATTASSKSIRVSVTAPTAFASTLASGSMWYFMGDPYAASTESATASLTWNWGNSAHTAIYADLPVAEADDTQMDSYKAAGASGSLSLSFPAAMVPTGYGVTLTDVASGGSLITSQVF